ncbi:MAG: hypothetical protein EXS63_02865 [Candidatus Omnitrophica bacterium]|nr:hypothetical protein [Candidatus Omnitrophota bacterium]
MLNAFVVVLREGFEAFLIVAVTIAYIKKMEQRWLLPAVYWGIAFSVAASGCLGWALLQGANQSLWEGVIGIVASILVTSLIFHMWWHGPKMKSNMESKLNKISSWNSKAAILAGVFLFTLLMISREGMETALILIQIHEPNIVAGILLGILAAGGFSWMWARFGHRINLKIFFQVTGIFLLLFVGQILIYSLHELSEAGVLPNSQAFHLATEPFSPTGIYGKWFSAVTLAVCGGWLVWAWMKEAVSSKR